MMGEGKRMSIPLDDTLLAIPTAPYKTPCIIFCVILMFHTGILHCLTMCYSNVNKQMASATNNASKIRTTIES